MTKFTILVLMLSITINCSKHIDKKEASIKSSKDSYDINDVNPKATIIYLTPLPTSNKERSEFNKELSTRLLKEFNKTQKVKILDLGKIMQENDNWEKQFLLKDGLHQNMNGVKIMAKLISKKIELLKNVKE